MKAIINIVICLLISVVGISQTQISGIVLGSKGDTIIGANVYIKDAFDGSSSDINGKFSFVTSETGSRILVASMIGYETFLMSVELNKEAINLRIQLEEKDNELNTVVISAGSFETGDVKKIAVLSSLDVATTAGATADIFGALKTLPGTQPAGEESGLFVRGGDATESRTFFDGMLVNNPFTSDLPDIAQRGRFSAFMFKGSSFSTGAYSAQYGQALSSTMSLDSKDIATKTKSDIGIMSVGLDVAHTQAMQNSSLEIGVSYYNLAPVFSVIKQNTEWTKEPESIHSNISYKLKTGKTGMLKLYGSYEKSHIGLITTDLNDISKTRSFDIKTNQLFLNSTWSQFISNKWKANAGISYGDDENNIDIGQDYVVQNEKSLHMRAGITHYFGKLSDIKIGVEYFNYDNQESYNDLSHQVKSPLGAAYIETNYFLTNSLVFRIGARYETSGIINADNIAPRLSLAYKLNDVSQISFAYGKFYQLPDDKFLFNSKSYSYQDATHYILNYQYQKEGRTLRLEAYYKKYENLLKQQQEPGIYDNSGYGYSKGIDLFYRDTKSITNGEFWISYSLLDTKRNYLNYPIETTPTFAAKHVANAVFKYYISDIKSYLGATYTYASGRPYYNPNNPDFLSDRTYDYHNFSLNLSYLTSIKGNFTILYVSVENVFGFNNVFSYRYSPDGGFRKPIGPAAPRSVFVGLFVTFGDKTYR